MKEINRKIYVIGLNSFKFKDLSLNIQDLFHKTENFAVPESFFDEVKSLISNNFSLDKKFFISKSNIDLIKWLKSINKDVILISRGDPLWYGIGRVLIENFSNNEISFYPANTCVQKAFSKLNKSWQDNKTISIHGRESDELIRVLKLKENSISILTDPKIKSLDLIRKNLKELNLEDLYDFWLIEELGLEKEKITLIESNEKLPDLISDLHLVILLKKESNDKDNCIPLFGIDDNYFKTFDDRPNLITKREIRIQLLADLELPEYGTLIDIGSGSGTIGLEALRIRPKLELICIDKRFGSKTLLCKNAKRLGVSPMRIIEGNIMKNLNAELTNSFSTSNRVIVGGCDKETKISIIKNLSNFMKKGDIFVFPIITYEALQQINLTLEEFNFESSMNLIQTFKGVSINEGTRFEPNNPVFIIKGKKK